MFLIMKLSMILLCLSVCFGSFVLGVCAALQLRTTHTIPTYLGTLATPVSIYLSIPPGVVSATFYTRKNSSTCTCTCARCRVGTGAWCVVPEESSYFQLPIGIRRV